MKTNLTKLVFILDRSGSMGGLESDIISGFNSMLAKQQAEPGECRITTMLLDHEHGVLHDRIDIGAVPPYNNNHEMKTKGLGCTDSSTFNGFLSGCLKDSLSHGQSKPKLPEYYNVEGGTAAKQE